MFSAKTIDSAPALPQLGITPPMGLMGAVLLFWGWQNDLMIFGVLLALLFEARHLIVQRWDIQHKDFVRLSDFSTALWFGVAVYFFITQSLNGLFSLLLWFPVLLAPLLLAQLYSSVGYIRLSAMLMSVRRAQKHPPNPLGSANPGVREFNLDISYPYLLLCLLSASIAQKTGFFVGLCLLSAWALWQVRPTRFGLPLWLVLLAAGFGLGYLGQIGIHQVQSSIENWILEWFEYKLWEDRDPYQRRTAIGEIGTLKTSNEILFRVQTRYPLLLRSASYDTYLNGSWFARRVGFKPIPPDDNQTHWALRPPIAGENLQSLEVNGYSNQGRALLPLPAHTLSVQLAAGTELQRNVYDNAVKISQGANLLNYTARYGGQNHALNADKDLLLNLPKAEIELFQQLAASLGLLQTDLSDTDKVRRIVAYFDEGFSYSLTQDKVNRKTALSDFLQHNQRGHCEYYATATSLLLRAAGIPSRYASGFAVFEYSFLEQSYIVRRRHAHAWVVAYVDGMWRNVDTTPADWESIEADQVAWWKNIGDFFSWLHYVWERWRWSDVVGENNANNPWLWAILPISAWLLWYLILRHRTTRQHKSAQKQRLQPQNGLDSPFYAVLKQMENTDHPRPVGQTLTQWCEQACTQQSNQAEMQALVILHNRYRFDPHGLAETEKHDFMQRTARVLKQA